MRVSHAVSLPPSPLSQRAFSALLSASVGDYSDVLWDVASQLIALRQPGEALLYLRRLQSWPPCDEVG